MFFFQWTESHENSFQKLKDSISNNVYLQCLDTTKPVTLQVDTSKVGLGAVLIQKDSKSRDRPVALVSRSVTPAETWYTAIECKMLGVFGCMKFHHYLYGTISISQSYHKPFDYLHLRYLSDAPPRLKMLLLKVQPYNLSVRYVPGPEVPMADVLCKVSPNENIEINGLDITIY